MLLDSFSLETETETEAEARARTSPGGEMGSLAASGGGRGVQEAEWARGAPSGRNPRCDVGNSGALLPEALRIPSSPSRPPRASPRPSPSQTSSAAPTLSHRAKRIPGPHGASHRPVSLFVSSPGLLLQTTAAMLGSVSLARDAATSAIPRQQPLYPLHQHPPDLAALFLSSSCLPVFALYPHSPHSNPSFQFPHPSHGRKGPRPLTSTTSSAG